MLCRRNKQASRIAFSNRPAEHLLTHPLTRHQRSISIPISTAYANRSRLRLGQLCQQPAQIQRSRHHCEPTIRQPRPLLHRTIPIKLHAIPIRITQIQRLAHAMIGCSLEPHSRIDQPLQSIRQLPPRRIHNRQMIKPSRSRSRRRPTRTLPRIQPNMVVIPARGKKHSRVSIPLRHRKPQHVPVEPKRPFQVRHLQMHMPNSRLWMNLSHINQMFQHSNPLQSSRSKSDPTKTRPIAIRYANA
jgi:hypothetical protein